MAAGRVSFGRVLRSDWIKFVTLRSNLPVFSAVVVGLAVMGMLPGGRRPRRLGAVRGGRCPGRAGEHVVGATAGRGPRSGVLRLGVHVWLGSARVTFLAVPTRIPVLLGKQLAIAVPAGIAGAAIASGGNALLPDAPPDTWAAMRAVAGAGLYLAAIASLSVAVAAILSARC